MVLPQDTSSWVMSGLVSTVFWYLWILIVAQKTDKTGFIQLLDVYVKHELVVAHGEHVLRYKCDGYYLSPHTTDLVGDGLKLGPNSSIIPNPKLNWMINQDSPQEETISKFTWHSPHSGSLSIRLLWSQLHFSYSPDKWVLGGGVWISHPCYY
jgi:hypothetical protein